MKRRLAAISMVAVLILAGGACSDDDGDSSASTTSDDGGSATTAGDTTTSEAGGSAVLIGTGDTDLGEVLTDTDGLTLYIFTDDEEGVSNCVDTCPDIWPKVLAENIETRGELDIEVNLVDGDEAPRQVTINGRPVYTYSGDTGPGQTTGQGVIGKWWALDPDGNPIEAAGDTTGTTITD